MNGVKQATDNRAQLRLDGQTVQCSGNWTVRQLEGIRQQAQRLAVPTGDLRVDISAVERMDTGGAWVLNRLLEQWLQQHAVELAGQSAEQARLLELVQQAAQRPDRVAPPVPRGMLERLGRKSFDVLGAMLDMLAFIGEVGSTWLAQLRHPRRIRWQAIADSLVEAGHRALGIVGLLAFLLGIVIAYQGGVQLSQYGASLFVADLVGLSMVRELAPMITAIIVAGRTGSAYTAQIGTMQVTEEVDALRSIGIPPLDLLVLPKVFALMIALPLLTVFADIMGIIGGMLMASMQLDIAFSTFIERVGVAVSVDSFLVGVGKAPVFAAIIAIIGCYQGFRVTGSAESVGRRTTTSVVQSILAVIVVDAAFSVAFSHLEI